MAEENTELDLGDEEAGGGKKKLIIIIVVAVLLIGGGVGAWLFLSGDEAPAEGEDAEQQAEEEGEEESSGEVLYHPLDPQFIVNLPPGGKVKMLQVEVQVLTSKQSVVDFLTSNEPMVRHHLLNLFSEQDGVLLKETSGREKLQKDVLEKIGELIEKSKVKGKVDEVFFTQFVVQ